MTLTPARILAPALLVAALALTGCSGTGDGGGDDASGSTAGAPEAADRGALDSDAEAFADGADSAGSVGDVAARPAKADAPPDENLAGQAQALIRKGNVALRADDVGRAQIEVQKVVDTYAGQVTDEKTQSDEEGRPAFTRMVLRIPSDDFDRAIEDLKGVGELETANTTQDDVTTEVIDVQTRLRVQKRSIARITVLFQQAQNIRDIMAIEAELSQRQADLDALEQKAAYLADQTSQSTIVVSIDQVVAKKKAAKHDDDAGFVAGLSAGWGALTTFAVGLATAVGALLPWLVVVAVVGIPTLLLVRSLRRRRPSPSTPAVEGPQPSE